MLELLACLVESYLRAAGVGEKDIENLLKDQTGIARFATFLKKTYPTIDDEIDEYDLDI